MINNIFFDLDGTLIDSVPDITFALNTMRDHYALAPISVKTVSQIIGKGFPTTVRKVLGLDLSADQVAHTANDAIKITKEAYAKYSGQQTKVYEGVIETLQQLYQSGIKMAVVTNKEYKDAIKVLAQCGLSEFFDVVIGGDSTTHYKPHPQPLIEAMSKLGAKLDSSIMVGDSRNDFECAAAANMRCVMVDYGYANDENVHHFGAYKCISQFNQLTSITLNRR